MNDQQRYLLKLLEEIHEICTANDITYFIGMGTLLGAVRNGGFLPWDDDADILMPYDSWQKFKEVCKTQLPDNRCLGSVETLESYGHIIPRYVSRDTTCFHLCQALSDDVAGMMIDIFILDPIADGEQAYRDYLYDLSMYTAVVNYSLVGGRRFEIDADTFKAYKDKERALGRFAVVEELENKLSTHFDPAGEWYAYRWHGVTPRYKRSWFEKTRPVTFEGVTLNAPYAVNEFLTCYYGEHWFEIPVVVAAEKHVTAESLRFPYTEALEFFHASSDRDALLADMEERNYLCYKNAHFNNALADDRMKIKAECIRIDALAEVQANRARFDKALAEGDAAALDGILHDYIAWQTSLEAIGRHFVRGWRRYLDPILIDVPDDVFTAALYALLGANKMRAISRLLDTRTKHGLPLTPQMASIQELLADYNRSLDCYQYERFDEGLALCLKLLDETPVECSSFARMACAHAKQALGADSDRFIALVDEQLKRHPEDGFFIKMRADALLAAGEEEKAHTLYLQAAENTRNGFSLADIAQKTGYYPEWMRTANWAESAGIPAWEGESPEPLQLPDPVDEPERFDDPRSAYLFDLFGEVTATCDSLGISYVLAPSAVQALARQDLLPDRVESYCIWCPADGMLALMKALGSNPGRSVEYLGNSNAVTDRSLRYHGDDSFFAELKYELGSFPSLYVTIAPIEPASYPPALAQALEAVASQKRISKSGRKKRLKAFLKRIRSPFGLKGAGDIYAEAMKYAAKQGGPFVVAQGKSAVAFDSSYIKNAHQLELRGRCMRVPDDIDGYLSTYPAPQADPWLRVSVTRACCTHASAADLVASGVLDADFDARIKQSRALNKRQRKIYRTFTDYFDDMKRAVTLKELSIDLLPRKDEIMELSRSGRLDDLKEIFAEYIACYRECGKREDFSFDDELFIVMKSVSER